MRATTRTGRRAVQASERSSTQKKSAMSNRAADDVEHALICREVHRNLGSPQMIPSDEICNRHAAASRVRTRRPRPIFVLCAARSGSTLLRYMLQAQGDIECPAESNLSQALAAIQFTYSVACGRPDQPEMWQLLADNECRRLADRALGARARLEHRKRWCDKSLSNIEYTSLLCRLFPDAQFLSIYRQCRDVIASALEASPWGLMGYGFEPYARETPANQVLALARYWADRTELGLAFERQHPNNCLGVKY